MNRRGAYHLPAGGLDDSMQADVMRFLAIIAICLLAVLALVRNVTPVQSDLPPMPVVSEAATVSPPAAPAPVPVAAASTPVAVVPAPAPTPTVDLAPTPQPVAAEPDPEPQPLSLRFASEHAFLALVNSNQVQVYAWRDGDTLQLTPSFQFAAVVAPGAVHEILASTLPAPVRTSFTRTHGQPTGWHWGVRLPGHTIAALDALVQQVSGGTLLIDAQGGLAHASP